MTDLDYDRRVLSKISRFPSRKGLSDAPKAVAIGNFDGLHLGHQRVLEQVVTEAASTLDTLLLSFYPHPSVVLGKVKRLNRLMSLSQRAELLAKLGISHLHLVHFTKQFASITATEFVDRILLDHLNLECLVVGQDAAFGKGREGTVDWMGNYLAKRGKRLVVVPFLDIDGQRDSSRRIRAVLEKGEIAEAAKLLGRPFTVLGRVRHGAGRGTKIGFPTANLGLLNQTVPMRGVYAGIVTVKGQKFKGVCNIGVRPTFGLSEESVEVHLLDAPNVSLYGERVAFEFHGRIRDEQKFASIEDLVAQISRDIETARKLLVGLGVS